DRASPAGVLRTCRTHALVASQALSGWARVDSGKCRGRSSVRRRSARRGLAFLCIACDGFLGRQAVAEDAQFSFHRQADPVTGTAFRTVDDGAVRCLAWLGYRRLAAKTSEHRVPPITGKLVSEWVLDNPSRGGGRGRSGHFPPFHRLRRRAQRQSIPACGGRL